MTVVWNLLAKCLKGSVMRTSSVKPEDHLAITVHTKVECIGHARWYSVKWQSGVVSMTFTQGCVNVIPGIGREGKRTITLTNNIYSVLTII